MLDVFHNYDICRSVLSFTSNDYLFLATVNKTMRKSYADEFGFTSTSYRSGIMESSSRTSESIDNGFKNMVNVYKHAIRLGSLRAVHQFYERMLHIDLRECFVDSIMYERLDIFKWISQGCDPGNTYWYSTASRTGKIPFLKNLKDREFAWDSNTTLEAAESGHTDSLIWLYENGCPMDERVITRAAVKGYDDIVVWASLMILDPPILLS